MALNFPSNPSVGDEFTGGGFTWIWDGSSWSKVVATAGGENNFALLVGASGNTTYVLDRTYMAGAYTVSFVNGDSTYDIYAIAADGTAAGYTKNGRLDATADFSEIVVIGAATNERIIFTYQGAITAPLTSGDKPVTGAFITSVTTSSLPNINDSTSVTGGNFATDVAVAFIGQDSNALAAKSVVRSSSTSLIATRPDALTTAQSPYSVRVLNPGVTAPTGTNAHILSNSVTAGTNPVWTTTGPLLYSLGAATSITLLATDTEGSDIDYTVVSGTIPAGLSLDSETGVISGTFSGSAVEGDTNSVTFRATDAGGNYLDKALDFIANAAPVWTTAAGALDMAPPSAAYSKQLVASTGTQGGTLSYAIQSGSLLNGLTLSSTGLISGSTTDPTDTVASFTVRVTDAAGLYTDRAFSLTVGVLSYYATTVTRTAPFTVGVSFYDQMYLPNAFVGHSGDGTTGYTLKSSFDAGQTWGSTSQTAWTYTFYGTTYKANVRPLLKDTGTRYYAPWMNSYNSGPSYKVASWTKSGSNFVLENDAIINTGESFFNGMYPARWGTNVGAFQKEGYLNNNTLYLYVRQFSGGSSSTILNGSVTFNSSAGATFSNYTQTRPSWIMTGKSWQGGNTYYCWFQDAWSATSGTYTKDLTGMDHNAFNALENGKMAFHSGIVGGNAYRAFTRTNGNPWSQIPASTNATWPTGVSEKMHINEAGTGARLFVKNLGVWSSSDLQTWTLTTVSDDYNSVNEIQVMEDYPSSGQETIMYHKTGDASELITVGTRTK